MGIDTPSRPCLSVLSKQNESSLFDELSVEDAEALGDVDDGCDITGESVILLLGVISLQGSV